MFIKNPISERGEARTKRLRELFPENLEYTKAQILDTLRLEGVIGRGLFGRLNGEALIRTVQPSNELYYIRGRRFYKTEQGTYYFGIYPENLISKFSEKAIH